MRAISSYAAIPTLDAVRQHYNKPQHDEIQQWRQVFLDAAENFDAIAPDIENQLPAIADLNIRRSLANLWDAKPAATKRLFQNMRDTLPPEDLSRCPFCNLSEDPELDHFLPKGIFPELSLHGRNLVPICGTCNKHKGTVVSDREGNRVILFPPFDLADGPNILEADLVFSATALGCTFRLDRPEGLNQHKFEIAERHFRRLNLGRRLMARGDQKLASLALRLGGLSSEVARQSIARWSQPNIVADELNAWESALRRAVTRSLDDLMNWLVATNRVTP